MNTEALALAYDKLLQAVEHYYAVVAMSDRGRAEADLRVVHIALSDELIGVALEATQNGEPALLNNRSAQDPVVIQDAIVHSTVGERIERLRDAARILVHRFGQLDAALCRQPVRLLVHDADLNLVADREMQWQELVVLRVTAHLPAHTKYFLDGAAHWSRAD